MSADIEFQHNHVGHVYSTPTFYFFLKNLLHPHTVLFSLCHPLHSPSLLHFLTTTPLYYILPHLLSHHSPLPFLPCHSFFLTNLLFLTFLLAHHTTTSSPYYFLTTLLAHHTTTPLSHSTPFHPPPSLMSHTLPSGVDRGVL